MSARSISLRRLRRLSTATSAAKPISISKAKSKLRSEHDPDKALEIYSSVSDHYTSPVSSRYAQDLAVKRLAKARRFSDIESLVESHKKDPKVTKEPYLCTLIRSYGRAGMFDHALRTYTQMEELGTPRSTMSFNALLAACNNSRLFDKVPELFDEMPKRYGIVPDEVSYGILVKSYCGKGSPELAIETLKGMEEKGIEVNAITFTTILDSLYKKGRVDEAEAIWNEMVSKGCELDAATYNVRIMHAHGGEPDKLKALIEEMAGAGIKPDTITYNCLMTCYCKNGMMDDAVKVYRQLEENGYHPNAATFRTLIYHLCRNERFGLGYAVFKKSVECHKIPDFGTLKHLVEGLVKQKKMDDAKGLIRTVKKKFPAGFLQSWKKVEVELGLASAELVPEEPEVKEAAA